MCLKAHTGYLILSYITKNFIWAPNLEFLELGAHTLGEWHRIAPVSANVITHDDVACMHMRHVSTHVPNQVPQAIPHPLDVCWRGSLIWHVSTTCWPVTRSRCLRYQYIRMWGSNSKKRPCNTHFKFWHLGHGGSDLYPPNFNGSPRAHMVSYDLESCPIWKVWSWSFRKIWQLRSSTENEKIPDTGRFPICERSFGGLGVKQKADVAT